MFFDGKISPEHIRDLSGTGDVRESFAPDGIYAMDRMLINYIHVLMKREKIYREMEGVSGDDVFFPTLQKMSEEEIDEIHRIDTMLAWQRENDPDGEKYNEVLRQLSRSLEELEAAGVGFPKCNWLKTE